MNWLLITYLSNLSVLPYSSTYLSGLLITYLSNLFVLPYLSTYWRTYLHMWSLLPIIFQYSYTASFSISYVWISHFDVFRPLVENTHLFTTFVVKEDGNFHEFPWSWSLFVILENILCWTHPLKLPYLDTWRSRLVSWLEVKAMAGQLTCLKVKAICHIWKTMSFWRSRLIIWLPLLN